MRWISLVPIILVLVSGCLLDHSDNQQSDFHMKSLTPPVPKQQSVKIIYPKNSTLSYISFHELINLLNQSYPTVENITVMYFENGTVRGEITFVVPSNETIYIAYEPEFVKIGSISIFGKDVNVSRLNKYQTVLFTSTPFRKLSYPILVLDINVSTSSMPVVGKIGYTLDYLKANYYFMPPFNACLGLPVSWLVLSGNVTENVKLVLPENYIGVDIRENVYIYKPNKTVKTQNDNSNVLIYKLLNVTSFRVRGFNVTLYLLYNLYASSPEQGYKKAASIIKETLMKYSTLLGNIDKNITVIFFPNWHIYTGMVTDEYVILGINEGLNELVEKNPTLFYHELAHLWFRDKDFQRIHESFASFMELYMGGSKQAFNIVESRVLRYLNYKKPLVEVYREGIVDVKTRQAIEYDKGAFVFRSLQFVLGNETFFEGLRELLNECHGKECNLTDVQAVFENVDGRNLNWFFKEWFYSTKVPDYDVRNLKLDQKAGKYLLNFEIIDKNNFTIPLEVEVITSRGRIIKKVWIAGSVKVNFELEDKPLKIILDPNEWMVNINRREEIDNIEVIIE